MAFTNAETFIKQKKIFIPVIVFVAFLFIVLVGNTAIEHPINNLSAPLESSSPDKIISSKPKTQLEKDLRSVKKRKDKILKQQKEIQEYIEELHKGIR